MKEYIKYRCKICGCEFTINKKYVTYAKKEHRYITCPIHGKHKLINVIGKENIKRIMEERKAVEI